MLITTTMLTKQSGNIEKRERTREEGRVGIEGKGEKGVSVDRYVGFTVRALNLGQMPQEGVERSLSI